MRVSINVFVCVCVCKIKYACAWAWPYYKLKELLCAHKYLKAEQQKPGK